MATSPIYNWPEPDNSDLVKNGALAMRTLGDAIDTTMATMVPKTIVDAKGDLIAASANDTPARLAVGNNGETLVADSSTSTGLRYTAGTVQSNPILNSAFQVWQRSTSVSVPTNSYSIYTADRWALTNGSANPNAATVSRQATGDTTNLPNIQYCARVQRNSGQTSTSGLLFINSFETINTIPFVGKTITVSFYARKGANYSPTGDGLTLRMYYGTGTDQNPILTPYTGGTNVDNAVTLTSTWQRFNVTLTVPTTATEMSVGFVNTPTGTAGAADFFEITGVQIDIGSVALPFRTYAGSIQGELAACQRYFYSGALSNAVLGVANSTTSVYWTTSTPVPMRIAPTATYPSTLTGIVNDVVNAQNRTPTAIATYVNQVDKVSFYATGMPAVFTIGAPALIQTTITWSAEL